MHVLGQNRCRFFQTSGRRGGEAQGPQGRPRNPWRLSRPLLLGRLLKRLATLKRVLNAEMMLRILLNTICTLRTLLNMVV